MTMTLAISIVAELNQMCSLLERPNYQTTIPPTASHLHLTSWHRGRSIYKRKELNHTRYCGDWRLTLAQSWTSSSSMKTRTVIKSSSIFPTALDTMVRLLVTKSLYLRGTHNARNLSTASKTLHVTTCTQQPYLAGGWCRSSLKGSARTPWQWWEHRGSCQERSGDQTYRVSPVRRRRSLLLRES